MLRNFGTPGYVSFSKARFLAEKKRLPSARRSILASLKSISRSVDKTNAQLRSSGLTDAEKIELKRKMERLRELNQMNLDLAKKYGIKIVN